MSKPNPSFAPSPSSCISRRCSIDSGACLQLQQQRKLKKIPAGHRRCSFSEVSVREYNQTLGDSPSCQDGAPITLGWKYAQQDSVPLDEFEHARQSQRRDRSELIIEPAERRKLLVMNGSTLMEILHAERLVAWKNGVASMGRQISQSVPSPSIRCGRKAPQRNKSMTSRAA